CALLRSQRPGSLRARHSFPTRRSSDLTLTGGGESAASVASAVELVLEGLHLSKRLNKDAVGPRATYRSRACPERRGAGGRRSAGGQLALQVPERADPGLGLERALEHELALHHEGGDGGDAVAVRPLAGGSHLRGAAVGREHGAGLTAVEPGLRAAAGA